jgi:tRNA A37 threonylcarbamoyladenosine modification protein TsaB
VSSLAALAFDCARAHDDDAIFVPVMDARRKEIFAGFFERRGEELAAIGDERVMPPDQLAQVLATVADGRPQILSGDGSLKYEDQLSTLGTLDLDVARTPSASAVAELARHQGPVDVLATAAPTYVRLSEAEIKFPEGNPGGTFSRPGKSG